MINVTKNLGMLLLAIYLILAGLGLLVHTIVIPVIIRESWRSLPVFLF